MTAENMDQDQDQTIKRSRGRPRKTPVFEAQTIKRGPGRPRKTPTEPVEAVLVVSVPMLPGTGQVEPAEAVSVAIPDQSESDNLVTIGSSVVDQIEPIEPGSVVVPDEIETGGLNQGIQIVEDVIVIEPTSMKERSLLSFSEKFHNAPLKDVKLVSYGTFLVDLENGIGIVQTDEGKGKKMPFPKPTPLLQTKGTKKRFYLMCMACLHLSSLKLDNFTVRAITASINLPSKHPMRSFTKEYNNDECLLHYSNFSRSKEGILTELWKLWFRDMEGKTIISVTDDPNIIKRYMYNNSVPTYKELTESEAINIVKNWCSLIFPLAVREIDTVQFYKIFLTYLATDSPVSTDSFTKMTPVGAYFKNFAATIEPGNLEVQLRPYNKSIVSPKRIIQSDYRRPSFSTSDLSGTKIGMSEEAINFLKVICGSESYNLNVLRVFLRNVLTAPYEGRFFQSALYLYGAPGTSKSMWAELIKALVPPEQIQEFSRTQNQFSAFQLKNCSVLIVSDLQMLLKSHTDVFRRILGRDQLTSEEKYVSGFEIVEPYCQVIIISNEPPDAYSLFQRDQALLDKLIKVYLGPELQIPTDLQIADLREHLHVLCSDIFNWAIHLKRSDLQHFIRAVDLNLLFDQNKPDNLVGLPAFVQQCMYKGSSADKVPLSDIKSAFVNWLDAVGDNTKSAKELTLSDLGSSLENLLQNTFGYKLARSRLYMKAAEGSQMFVRPMGYFGVCITNGKTYVSDSIDENKRFHVKSSGKATTLSDPFSSDKVVTWVQSSDSDQGVLKIQKEILNRRKAILSPPPATQTLLVKGESGGEHTNDREETTDKTERESSFSKEEIPEVLGEELYSPEDLFSPEEIEEYL